MKQSIETLVAQLSCVTLHRINSNTVYDAVRDQYVVKEQQGYRVVRPNQQEQASYVRC